MKWTIYTVAFVFLLSVSPIHTNATSGNVGFLPDGPAITEDDVLRAQEAWGNAVVAIGAAGKDAPAVAEKSARAAYAFNLGPIQFKPTLAVEIPFRPDLEGTLSYFVNSNKERYPEDEGFALKRWQRVRFENDTIKIHGNIAITMGHYYFKCLDSQAGQEIMVEYTKGYVKTPDNQVRIFLQHSSKPYSDIESCQ